MAEKCCCYDKVLMIKNIKKIWEEKMKTREDKTMVKLGYFNLK
jgi:hypothetical protein